MISSLIKKREKYLPFVLMLAGALFRLVCLGVVPEGYEQDEAYAAWNSFSLYHAGIDSAGHSFPVYFEAWGHGQSALLTYLMLPLIAIRGGHVNLLIIRLPQAIVSIFTLAAVYFLMREMYDERAAKWALFLTAICPWHIMMSRWGLDANLAPGFLLFGLCFFVYGLRKPPLLILSAVCYGLCLYCYALMWVVVPFILVVQGLYCLCHRKLRLTGWVWISGLLLGMLAFPLLAFLLVNNGYLPSFCIGPFSVYRMAYVRQNEFASNLAEVAVNIKTTLKLFFYQSDPYGAISPYGFFYRAGSFFAVIGLFALVFRVGGSVRKKVFTFDALLFAQLLGAGLIGMLVCVDTNRINVAFLPLVLCEAQGVVFVCSRLSKLSRRLGAAVPILIICLYLCELTAFQIDYYTEYREASSVPFYKGADEAVRFACEVAGETGREVQVRTGLHYPNILLALETDAAEYLESVVYSEYPPTPSEFEAGGVTIHMGIDRKNISPDRVYIFIEPDRDQFEGFHIEQFTHWYVAW